VNNCRRGLVTLCAGVALLLCLPAPSDAASGPASKRIGIVGAGKMGGTLAELWSKAGYTVMISSRHPEELKAQASALGPSVEVGTPEQAAKFGPVVVIAVPYGAEPELGRELAPELANKVVIDLGNPYPARDGPMAEQARAQGTGVASAKFFPGARLVRAFNAINYNDLASQARRAGERVAIPIAADDKDALAVTVQLVRDAGFDPVVVGDLSTAKRFDVGSPVYVKVLTAEQLRAQLGLPPQ
jgi:8-hydroxy-5-deazaflavin:NADPH oxidoreductase